MTVCVLLSCTVWYNVSYYALLHKPVLYHTLSHDVMYSTTKDTSSIQYSNIEILYRAIEIRVNHIHNN